MMNDKQIEAHKSNLNKMAESLRADWDIAVKKGSSQYASNLNGRIKGVEFSLVSFNDALNDDQE